MVHLLFSQDKEKRSGDIDNIFCIYYPVLIKISNNQFLHLLIASRKYANMESFYFSYMYILNMLYMYVIYTKAHLLWIKYYIKSFPIQIAKINRIDMSVLMLNPIICLLENRYSKSWQRCPFSYTRLDFQ